MLHRLPSRLARPSASLLSSAASSSSRLTLTRPSIRTATTAHNESRGQDTHHSSSHHGDAHGGHDDHFDPPSGWLWGQRPGEKYEKEGWEGLAWVFVASWVVAVAAYTMKEDTSIQTWALEEARRRLEKEGFYDDK